MRSPRTIPLLLLLVLGLAMVRASDEHARRPRSAPEAIAAQARSLPVQSPSSSPRSVESVASRPAGSEPQASSVDARRPKLPSTTADARGRSIALVLGGLIGLGFWLSRRRLRE